ncbi:maleylpyruvate isomerase family mycothiol-dependent enzyme [Streptomyces panaciradicis]|uniref:maleylpyruvate isomerase family mycothiol-dependent enzyme n=1 Tax=Streptomyces panaciradicis TaxID=1470261 RepID=UPI00201D0BFC|nr:maleylpyruvate isomerase family mycothiol-dependent enzyme [Streptomyces panaciradicis]MCL6672448.1 maleylpyruvate isomerase family mycothiol-dependent enzyme [Streptomyces panaciradicis]
METAEFLRTLDREGRLLAVAAERAGTDAEVPTCADWTVRDLLRHTGVVHRWAAGFVGEGYDSPRPMDEPPELDGPELLEWFRAGHRRLVDILAAAPSDVQCWHFLPAPSPLAFWTRRQAHETAVHRIDAEAAGGGEFGDIAREFAADGVDELLRGFHARARSKVRSEEPRVLRVRATDVDGAVWTVRLSAQPPVTVRDDGGAADCELTGPAAQLYLSLWNREPFPGVTGDASVAALWRARSAIV